MKISFDQTFLDLLNDQVRYISKDKPAAAKKFKKDLIQNLKKDLQNPFAYKKSIYFHNDSVRDYVFKGYTIVYRVEKITENVLIFEFIKHMNSL